MEDRKKMAGRLRLAGRVVGFTMIGLGGTMLIGAAVTEFSEGFAQTEPAGFILAAIGAVALAGMILSFWRERIGGILLLACSAALGAHIANFAGRNHLLAWATVGLPFLVSGVLFVNAWRISKID